MNTELSEAWELFGAGDAQGAMRLLRRHADELPPAEAASLVARLAEDAGFDDLAGAAAALAAAPGRPEKLFDYGYACIERGVSALAVPALREALQAALRGGDAPKRSLFGRKPSAGPGADPRQTLLELAIALEDGERHAEAVEVLGGHDALLADWPDRYLLVHNALMAGRVDTARPVFERLGEPGEQWRPAADRIRRTLVRHGQADPAGGQDLRGWHYALTGGVLTTLAPYGWDAGMTGRWAYLQDSYASCRYGLERLRTVLDAAGHRPARVGLLPDRGSRILGLAAASLLGVPAEDHRPGVPDTLVVAYDLNESDPRTVAGLAERAPGEVLFEHATCWTDTPAVSADVCTLLGQTVIAPWDGGLRISADGEPEQQAPDGRSPDELAKLVLAADGGPDEGDGATPADPDEALAAFVRRVRGSWLDGARDRVRSAGPVRSSRFA